MCFMAIVLIQSYLHIVNQKSLSASFIFESYNVCKKGEITYEVKLPVQEVEKQFETRVIKWYVGITIAVVNLTVVIVKLVS